MVRTRADNTARKAVAAKAPRKVLGASGGGGASCAGMASPSGKVSKYAGGNIVQPRPTPDWQKGISGFLVKSPPPKASEKENASPEEIDEGAGASSAECGGSSSQSSSTVPEPEPEPSSSASPLKKNGLISDDEDDE